MRIALLTTESAAATECARILGDGYDLCGIVIRPNSRPLPFDTFHFLDREQEAFEIDAWFGGTAPDLSDMAPVVSVPDMASDEAAEKIKGLKPDAIVTLNAGSISQAVLGLVGTRSVVLHAGNPHDYRGEDTHLWSVYHGDVEKLECIVQYATTEINTGSVLFSTTPTLSPDMPLAALRKAMTDGYMPGMEKVLRFFDGGGMLTVNRLQRLGKVYTPMPAVLKDYCIEQFACRTVNAK